MDNEYDNIVNYKSFLWLFCKFYVYEILPLYIIFGVLNYVIETQASKVRCNNNTMIETSPNIRNYMSALTSVVGFCKLSQFQRSIVLLYIILLYIILLYILYYIGHLVSLGFTVIRGSHLQWHFIMVL